tara:strand:- start:28170 stop:29339 length:1170 start_codon:yes stop_codon:yes gene_type:complete
LKKERKGEGILRDLKGVIDSSAKVELLVFNGGGRPRWVIPLKSKHPTFLELYNSNTLKGGVYRTLVLVSFYFGFKRLFSSSRVYGTLSCRYKSILKKLDGTGYSVFLGTPGEDRKVIIEVNSVKGTFAYIKIPASDCAKALIDNELKTLLELADLKMALSQCPEVLYSDSGMIAVSNIKPLEGKNIACKGLTKLHFSSIHERYKIFGCKEKNLLSTSLFKSCFERLKKLKISLNNPNFSLLKELHVKLLSNINMYSSATIKTSLNHGDFTPWNMYVADEKLHIYDWELARNDLPLLYDIFHYIFQSKTLLFSGSYSDVMDEIDVLLNERDFMRIVNEYEIDINFYLKLYVLNVACYYLPKYSEQDDLHEQAIWLMGVWRVFLTNDLVND